MYVIFINYCLCFIIIVIVVIVIIITFIHLLINKISLLMSANHFASVLNASSD